MATTITNKTHKPLSLRLARGKVLHLGPGKSGQIASSETERAPVQALITEGAIEITDDRNQAVGGAGGPRGAAGQPRASGGGFHRGGDR